MNTHTKYKWVLLGEDDKVLAKFRFKSTAINNRFDYKNFKSEKTRVISIEEYLDLQSEKEVLI